MHESKNTIHDPFRMLAVAIFAQAVRDYTAPLPKDTGHASVDNRRKSWKVNHVSAEWFLFKDVDYMGRFHIFCMLVRIDPNIARRELLVNKHNMAGIVEKLFYSTRNTTKALDIANDK
jgi:hypothetical protein